MPFLESDGWSFDIVEWWDTNGDYHQGEPTTPELEEAFQITGHFHDSETGDDRYTTMFSGDTYDTADGWYPDELEVEIYDWYDEGSGEIP